MWDEVVKAYTNYIKEYSYDSYVKYREICIAYCTAVIESGARKESQTQKGC